MSATNSAAPTPDPDSPAWSIFLDSQSFNVIGLDGTPTTLTFDEFNAWIYEIGAEAGVAGFALGFASMLLIILFIVTPAAKIRKPIFLLNVAGLFFVAFREMCSLIVLCASYQGVGQTFLNAIGQYPSTTWTPNVITTILAFPIYGCNIASLVLQVRVVFAAEPLTRKIITWFGTIAAVVEMGLILAWLVFIDKFVLRISDTLPLWLYKTYRIYFVCFVGISCLIFLYKLGVTINRRRKMGMNATQFGPLQIVFVMFCQCLIVPRKYPSSDLPKLTLCFSYFLCPRYYHHWV